jgi:hypothetical protein
MAIVSKVNRDGIDIAIESIQQKMYPNLLGAWDASTVYTMYPRANKNYKQDNILPEISLDKKDYKDTLYDDKVFVNSFFLVNDDSVYDPKEKTATQNISLIFQADLVKLYGDSERVDEVFNADVLRVLDLLKRRTSYLVGDITVTRGFDKVYSDLSFTSDFKEKIKYSDISHRHIVKFTFDIIYALSCAKTVTPVCSPVSIYENDILVENVPSGGEYRYSSACLNANVTVNSSAFNTVASGGTLDVPVEYENGTLIGTITGGIVKIPNPVELDRVYIRPAPTGQTAIYEDYDDGWKVANSSDTYIPPSEGYLMRVDPSNMWKVTYNNIFGHLWRVTGATGGYWDNVLLDWFDVDGNSTTYALAFPNDYMIDHHTGLGWVNTSLTSKRFSTIGDNIFTQMNTYSNAGFSDYFVGNKNENDSITDIGRQWAFYNQPPFDNIGSTNKWSSTSVAYSATTAYSNRITGETTGTSKGSLQITVPMRYHFT